MNEKTEHAAAAFEDASARYHDVAPKLEQDAITTALYLIATHVLEFAPEATHMLMESSDQGDFMCPPYRIEQDGKDLVVGVEGDWEDVVEDNDLQGAASWLTWGADAWEQYVDQDHPYTNTRGGYCALDLRRIGAAL
jgi:hypothetical protein